MKNRTELFHHNLRFFSPKSMLNRLYLLLLTLSMHGLSHAEPWDGFGRTYQVSQDELDEQHDFAYSFGVKGTLSQYRDPDFRIGFRLPTPFADPKFQSYNIIIVVNDNAVEPNPTVWGPPQTMRVYSRFENQNKKGLLYFWNISTGESGATNKGYYRPQSFSSRHWSTQFDAPMLWSVFFDKGKALHSSLADSDLLLMGRGRSSKGYVHIEVNRAEELFHQIGQSGYGKVNVFSSSGNLIRDSQGNLTEIESYKTLIIIH